MQEIKNKPIAVLITLILLASYAFFFDASPSVNAQQYTNLQEGGSILLPPGVTPDYTIEDTIARLSFFPNPVGVGQTVVVSMWIAPPIHPSHYFTNYTTTITKPDGSKQTITREAFRADTSLYVTFVPDVAGKWTIKFDFPGAYFPAGNYSTLPGSWIGAGTYNFPYSTYYKPTSAGPYELTVQDQPVAASPVNPLPTEYWTRPVSPENKEWWPLLGYSPSQGVVGKEDDLHWALNTNKYALNSYGYIPYTPATLAPHVMWKRQQTIGGLIGGVFEEKSMGYNENHWRTLFAPTSPSLLYAGRAYHDFTKVVDGVPTRVFQCYDIRTGEVLFERTGMDQVPQYITYWEGYADLPGGEPLWERHVFLTYVGGGRLIYYHPLTAAVMYNVSISPLTTGVLYGHFAAPLGDQSAPGGNVPYFQTVQNLGSSVPADQRYRLITWTAAGDQGASRQITNVRLRVISNITWTSSSLGSVDYEAGISYSTQTISNPYTLAEPLDILLMATDLNTGQLLWNISTGFNYPTWSGFPIADHGKVALRLEDGFIYCFNGRTGQRLWKSEISSEPWGVFNAYGSATYGGNIITGQYDGVAAYDWETGKLSWIYHAKSQYPLDTPYQDNYPFFSGSPVIADGVVYMSNAEHTATNPFARGWRLHAFNATTGEGIWSISGSLFQISGSTHAGFISLHDGYLVFPNSLDGYQYVYGKGPSKTTVTAPDRGVIIGDIVVIRGTVTDQSEAQKGTPAISDESMSAWMEHIHMQLPLPENVTGVPVTLSVIDANGNNRVIGTTVSDINGGFGLSWKPDIPGDYTIFAKFAGSNSYGSSTAQTYMTVAEAHATIPPAEPLQDMTGTYLSYATIAIIVTIVIVGAVILIALRKR